MEAEEDEHYLEYQASLVKKLTNSVDAEEEVPKSPAATNRVKFKDEADAEGEAPRSPASNRVKFKDEEEEGEGSSSFVRRPVPPSPPERKSAPANRQFVVFSDDPNGKDNQVLNKHGTLKDLDTSDLHSFDEEDDLDVAEREMGAQDEAVPTAGTIEHGVTIQPAITLPPSTTGRKSLSIPAQSYAVTGTGEAPPPAFAEEEEEVTPPPRPKLIDITVRTLSGKETVFAKLDAAVLTIGWLRREIFERFPGISFDEQRLLFKSKLLEVMDLDMTLEQAGIEHQDVIRLVRTVQNVNTSAPAHAHAPTPPPPAVAAPAPDLEMLTVLVPPGRGPGDKLRIVPQGRGPMIVTVPAGVGVGDQFRVLLPPEDPAEFARAEQALAAERQRMEELNVRNNGSTSSHNSNRASVSLQRHATATAPASANRGRPGPPQIMAVLIPNGYSAGMQMDVNVPGRGRVRVAIPRGYKAGQTFKFRLPANQ